MKLPLPDEVRDLVENTPKNMEKFSDGIKDIGEKLDTTNELLKEILVVLTAR